MLTVVLLTGWGFRTTALSPLQEALQRHFPNAHYLTPSNNCSSIQSACDLRQWRTTWWPTSATPAASGRVCYIGWSLGGLLASRLAALPDAHTAALITLGTNRRFVADEQWPSAMPSEEFTAFMQAWLRRPSDTLRHFTRLASQGCPHPRALRTSLSEWADASLSVEEGRRQLEWLNGTDLYNDWVNKQYTTCHMFAADDALVPSTAANTLADNGHRTELLPATGHLFPATEAEQVAARVANLLAEADSRA